MNRQSKRELLKAWWLWLILAICIVVIYSTDYMELVYR